MSIDKNKILELFNDENYQGIKMELEKCGVGNKVALLKALSEVIITNDDLTCYNTLMMKYKGEDIIKEIKKIKLSQLSILRKEIEKL